MKRIHAIIYNSVIRPNSAIPWTIQKKGKKLVTLKGAVINLYIQPLGYDRVQDSNEEQEF